MFFAANALLASIQKQIKDTQGVHSKIYHALQYYFVLQSNQLPKKIITNYEISLKEAKELLQLNISNLKYESNKRKAFTYEINKEATLAKSSTSYERAREFIRFVERII